MKARNAALAVGLVAATAIVGVALVAIAWPHATGQPRREPRSPRGPCSVEATCAIAPPDVGEPTGFRHTRSKLTAASGAPRHRGRDLLLRASDPQWLIAKLAYGRADDDLEDEDVDVWVARGCRAWERLATVRTTSGDGQHPGAEGIADDEGRVFHRIPDAQRLAPGWHRVLFVVRGDGSRAEASIRVVGPATRAVVSDVDGTLTHSEMAAFTSRAPPRANPGAAEVLWALASRGYDIVYLTARPEWHVPTTRRWLAANGFPPGLLRTTTTTTGLFGDGARDFKTAELRGFAERLGRAPDMGFGNMPSDVEAYAAGGVPAASRYFFRLDGDARGGVIHGDYRTLLPAMRALPPLCR